MGGEGRGREETGRVVEKLRNTFNASFTVSDGLKLIFFPLPSTGTCIERITLVGLAKGTVFCVGLREKEKEERLRDFRELAERLKELGELGAELGAEEESGVEG